MTRLLLDMGLPRRAASDLREWSWDVAHVAERGMSRATDREILAVAAQEQRAVVTLDGDFARLVALELLSAPSIIFFRLDHVDRRVAVDLLTEIVPRFEQELAAGCVVSVGRAGCRVHKLPVR
ncbi:MAG: DUF5615 family PIN-like protein [Deltaproteobacteria bacterium]|nr:DUF5615 family PIN-like protein [Deltaproteobacteria bacterium]